ncbi:AraC family transcriptional regulator [Actinocatenispora thailandica]|uniref:AraC family transcriptional regulator n=1 Tax=Actinocatenispora thailandica TaxID=227318 RepID=A0A7R7DJ84_9ACTN|nr:helix-turn-helix domain-containing protein [Actinocatenispora thailandica]BCJ32640.1 AraC family transcriptional regulator [Actinocatenispora thailandica]
MLRTIAAVALDGVAAFELGVICEVFGVDRTAQGFPPYEFALCSPGGRPVRCKSGYQIVPDHDLAPLADADVVAVPAMGHASNPPAGPLPVPAELTAALRAAAARNAWVVSVCSGAFVLGEAGLLDGRRCTTHWMYAADLAARYPTAKVDPDVLYVEDRPILTSAGTAAGIDACLHLVRQEQGSAVATALARRMVVPPHRDGGQAQYIETPVPVAAAAESLQPLLTWMQAHLAEELTVEALAARVHLAPRTFARRFRAETGATPHDWLVGQRVLLARTLLEETELGVEQIARRAGFGNAAALRHHFTRRLGTAPVAYRRRFCGQD